MKKIDNHSWIKIAAINGYTQGIGKSGLEIVIAQARNLNDYFHNFLNDQKHLIGTFMNIK